MPYEIGKHPDCPMDKPHAVLKKGTGERMGCHPTKEAAMKQMAALYAQEGMAMGKASWTTAYINDLPDSAFACVLGSGDDKQRFYPHHDQSGKLDIPHLRAAMSRVGDKSNEQCGGRAHAHLEDHAMAEGMGGR